MKSTTGSGKYVSLTLSKGLHTIIDAEDALRCSEHNWYASKTTYNKYRAIANIKGKNIKLHRLLMGFPVGLDVHHKNGDCLDNRKSNLIACTRSEHSILDGRKPPLNKLKGSAHPTAKLNNSDVRMIIYMKRSGLFSSQELSDIYEVSLDTICCAIAGRRYKDVWKN